MNNDKPNINDDEPNINNDKPNINNDEQNMNNGKPNIKSDEQNMNNDEPNTNNDEPNINNDEPNTNNDEPNVNNYGKILQHVLQDFLKILQISDAVKQTRKIKYLNFHQTNSSLRSLLLSFSKFFIYNIGREINILL